MDARLSKQLVWSRFIWFACLMGMGIGWWMIMTRDREKSADDQQVIGPGINDACPLTMQPVEESVRPVRWRGMTLGFCSEQCSSDWRELDEIEREVAMTEAGISFVGSGFDPD